MINLFDLMRFGIRIRFKDSYKALKREQDKEEFFSQLKILYKIDPFKHFLWFCALWFGVLWGFGLKGSLFVLYPYVLWVVLYFITLLGVYYMHKDTIAVQDKIALALEEDRKKREDVL